MRRSASVSKQQVSGRSTLPANIATATTLDLAANWTFTGMGGFGTVYTSKKHPDVAVKTSALNRCAKLHEEYNVVTTLASYVHRESAEQPFRHVDILGAHMYSPKIDTTVHIRNANGAPIEMNQRDANGEEQSQIIDGVDLTRLQQEQCAMFMDYIAPPPGHFKPIQAWFGSNTYHRDMKMRGLLLGAKELKDIIKNEATVREMMSELGRMLAMIQYGAMHTATDLEIILGSVPMSSHHVSSSVVRTSSKKSTTKKRRGRGSRLTMRSYKSLQATRKKKPTIKPTVESTIESTQSRALRLFFIDFDLSHVWVPRANNTAANTKLLVRALDSVAFFPRPEQEEYYSLFRAAYMAEALRHNHHQLAEAVLTNYEDWA